MLADKNLENDMRMIAKHGRIVVIGSRGSVEMTPRLLMAKESVVMGMAIWHSAPEEARMAEAAVAAALRSGALRPVLGDILPLEKAAQAHEDIIARGGKPGKMLIGSDSHTPTGGLFVKGTSASVIWESLFFKTDRGGVLIISIYDS